MIQFILTFPFASTARAGGVPLGGACSTDKLHLDPSTHRLVGSDCGHDGVCSNNTCVTKGCRRDEYPFGFHLDSNETLPPMCIDGLTFCPDDEDSCRSLVELGQTCELNRDDECKPPIGNDTVPICLNSVCWYANVTFGLPCVIENTVYTGEGPGGQQFINVVSRDNCIEGYYCDDTARLCNQAKSIGLDCKTDKECITKICSTKQLCEYPPEQPLDVPLWQFIITAFCIIGGIALICWMLVTIHNRHRAERRIEVREYYREQTNLRNCMLTLNSAAASRATSINTIPGEAEKTLADLQIASGLEPYPSGDHANMMSRKNR